VILRGYEFTVTHAITSGVSFKQFNLVLVKVGKVSWNVVNEAWSEGTGDRLIASSKLTLLY